jgi:hypothetical protein
MADVQNVNFIFAHGEKDSIFVPAATVKNLADFCIEKPALRREQTAFGKNLRRKNHFQQPVIPAEWQQATIYCLFVSSSLCLLFFPITT